MFSVPLRGSPLVFGFADFPLHSIRLPNIPRRNLPVQVRERRVGDWLLAPRPEPEAVELELDSAP